MKRNRIKVSSIVCGLLFLKAGILLFAFNTGLLPVEYKSVVFSWPMLLVAIGLVWIFSRHKWITGIVLMLIGGFFLIPKLHIEDLNFVVNNGWAIGLIIGRVLIICRTIWGKHFIKFYKTYWKMYI